MFQAFPDLFRIQRQQLLFRSLAIAFWEVASLASRVSGSWDIKANNVLIDSTGNAKLCDFGLAVKVVPGTKLKTFCRTLAYCAREVFGVEPYDGYASDVWSLGVLLYFMVARHLPFQASSSAGLRQQILAANFSVSHHVPSDIFSMIVELLMINPDGRPTISQILRRPMIRDSQARASIQSLPGIPSPSIVSTMTGMGYQREEMIECLRDQKYNQAMATYLSLQHRALGVDCCHHRVKPTKPMEPGLVLNLVDLHTFLGPSGELLSLLPQPSSCHLSPRRKKMRIPGRVAEGIACLPPCAASLGGATLTTYPTCAVLWLIPS
ncbi:hypothetical protein ACRRTK_024046 [Alexandromys fortis]